MTRRARPLASVLAALLAFLLVGALLAAPAPDAAATVTSTAASTAPRASEKCRGARAFTVSGCSPLQRSGSLTPTTTRAPFDKPVVYDRSRRCISPPPSFPVLTCELGLRRGRLHLALLGNSIASQWADAVARIGRDHGWRVTTYLASGCSPSELVLPPRTFPDASAERRCLAWGKAVRERMIRQGVDVLLVSSGSLAYPDQEAAAEGYVDYLRPFTSAGVLVETLRMTPHATVTLRDSTPPECLRANVGNYLNCSGPRDQWLRPDPLHDAGARLRRDRSGRIDLTDRMCTARTCVSAAGGVLLWRDGLHLTRTYVETLRPTLDQRLLSQIRADRG